jgi:putative flippase GtrA
MNYSQQLKHEISHFLVIGIFATLVDFSLYFWWHHYMPFSLAKTLSFICGSCVAYLLNKFFTFKQAQHSNSEVSRFVTLYTTTMLANVWVNSLCLWLIQIRSPTLWNFWRPEAIIIAFVCATGVSTILNFFGQKFWVFRRKIKVC